MESRFSIPIFFGLFNSFGSTKFNFDLMIVALLLSYKIHLSWSGKEIAELRLKNEKLKKTVKHLENANSDVKNKYLEIEKMLLQQRNKILGKGEGISTTRNRLVKNINEEYEREIMGLKVQIMTITQQKDQFKKICKRQNGLSCFFLKQSYSSINETTCSENISIKSNEESKCSEITKESSKNYELLLSKIEDLLVCPISFKKIKTPVILPSGKTIDKSTFEKLVEANKCDPFTRDTLENNMLINRLAINLIEIVEMNKKSYYG